MDPLATPPLPRIVPELTIPPATVGFAMDGPDQAPIEAADKFIP